MGAQTGPAALLRAITPKSAHIRPSAQPLTDHGGTPTNVALVRSVVSGGVPPMKPPHALTALARSARAVISFVNPSELKAFHRRRQVRRPPFNFDGVLATRSRNYVSEAVSYEQLETPSLKHERHHPAKRCARIVS